MVLPRLFFFVLLREGFLRICGHTLSLVCSSLGFGEVRRVSLLCKNNSMRRLFRRVRLRTCGIFPSVAIECMGRNRLFVRFAKLGLHRDRGLSSREF